MKKFASLLLAVSLAAGLAACGSSAASGAASSAAPAAASASQAAAPAAAQATPTLDAIKAKGKLVMMTATGFPPFEYLGSDGKPAGVDIDIAKMVADELGVELEVLDMDFALLIESLKSGKGDLVAAGMTVTDERKSQIDFTNTYATAGQVVLIPIGSDIKSVEDLKDKKIAVQESTTGHIYVQEELGLTPMAFKNAVECAAAVAGGKADAAVIDSVAAVSLIKSYADKLTSLEEMITAENFAIGVAKGNDDLLAFTNEVIDKAVAAGKIDALIEQHNKVAAEG